MTRILVETKYLPATNTRGARIKATAASFKPLTLGWNYAMFSHENHEDAARTLLVQRGWRVLSVERFDAPCGTGSCFVITAEDTL